MINVAALLAWIAANWLNVAIVGGAAAYVGYENRDKLKTMFGAKPATDTSVAGLSTIEEIVAKIHNLPIVQQLGITIDDIKRTADCGMLVRLSNRIDQLPEPQRQEGRAAIAKLTTLVIQGPDKPAT